ncbi:MarR family winged helix-turn-helix transcriptional regulator [Leekyejoonella antrihumi]|uniref:Winged helix-turn-helix transcriptional regulator n=1 Tax=Leekyejoonella antrihumi TaxID=1660198 RepID=A0A563E848_9MICO|nr:MarR family winged helix-turn-helix transcriptional regulator [Leekyejoonella antrihumi]TWP38700.1 winged helix-turn-helix transcriptional regulator [Leekyejoonella antrihumi]
MESHLLEIDAVRALTRAARLMERAAGDLTLAQYRVLSAVAEGTSRASRLANRLALGKPAVSGLVDALCHKGMLRRGAVPDDLRAVTLTLTDEGGAALLAAEAGMSAELRTLAGFADDPAGLIVGIARLGAAIEAAAQVSDEPLTTGTRR